MDRLIVKDFNRAGSLIKQFVIFIRFRISNYSDRIHKNFQPPISVFILDVEGLRLKVKRQDLLAVEVVSYTARVIEHFDLLLLFEH